MDTDISLVDVVFSEFGVGTVILIALGTGFGRLLYDGLKALIGEPKTPTGPAPTGPPPPGP
jgi:hypothetical protein